eukprot:2702948-Rhodomonas_salina.2
MSGTHVAYRATGGRGTGAEPRGSGHTCHPPGTSLRPPYAMSGTSLACGASGLRGQDAYSTSAALPSALRDVRIGLGYADRIGLRLRYAMPGTDVARYQATQQRYEGEIAALRAQVEEGRRREEEGQREREQSRSKMEELLDAAKARESQMKTEMETRERQLKTELEAAEARYLDKIRGLEEQ